MSLLQDRASHRPRAWTRLWWPSALALALLVSAASAEAQAPARVALALEGEWPDELRSALRADLEASLRSEGFELVHAADGAAGVLAIIRVSAPDHGDVRVRIEDAVTDKHVERVLELGEVPRDAWSVGIAAGADELLRASWAELVLDDAPPPAIAAPAVERTLARHMEPERVAAALEPGLLRLALVGAVEGYLGGDVHIGGDVRARIDVARPLAIEASVGARGSPAHASARGEVQAASIGGSLALALALLPPRDAPFELDVLVGLRAAYVRYDAAANTGSAGAAGEGALLSLRASLRPGLRIGALWLAADLGVGVPLLAVEARDEVAAIVGTTELELHAGLVVGVIP